MVWILPLLPIVAGAAIWSSALGGGRRRRGSLAAAAAVALGLTAIVALAAALAEATATYVFGAGITLLAEVGPVAGTLAVLVPLIALAVTTYAARHEPAAGLPRLLGLLTVFVGAMELVIVANDLLTLLIGWELIAGLSWALIGFDWHDAEPARRASHAFNATRAGGLGLVLAAGAAFAQTGSFAYDRLGEVGGVGAHVLAAGILLAAIAKSAQVPFAPWLYSAMAGPTPVSALLHSSTMVAAGAYLVIRLEPVLIEVAWFGPAAIGIGLTTALAGGVAALLQQRTKPLLAASTSAQYGLMFVAVGAGYPTVALLHLVAHALFKAHLFLAAGVAKEATGTEDIAVQHLGRRLRFTARSTLVAAAALAAVPPLGAAFTKEEVAAAAGHEAPWLAVGVLLAGALSAAYAARFQVLVFGREDRDVADRPRALLQVPTRSEHLAMLGLAIGSLALSVLWLPAVGHELTAWLGGEAPEGAAWEFGVAIGSLVLAVYAVILADRRGRLATLGASRPARLVADWYGLPALTEHAVVDPVLAFSAALARFDDRVVDAGVHAAARVGALTSRGLRVYAERGFEGVVAAIAGAAYHLAQRTGIAVERAVEGVVAAIAGVAYHLAERTGIAVERAVDATVDAVAKGVDGAATDVRRMQSGQVHHYLVLVPVGLAITVVAAAIWR